MTLNDLQPGDYVSIHREDGKAIAVMLVSQRLKSGLRVHTGRPEWGTLPTRYLWDGQSRGADGLTTARPLPHARVDVMLDTIAIENGRERNVPSHH